MYYKKKSVLFRLMALVLIVATLLPMSAGAAVVEPVQPMASSYLNSYNAYISLAGNGRIHACFSVIGTGYMDSIGSLRIALYESTDNSTWTWVKTYSNDNYPSMLAYDAYTHSGYFTYQGVAGRYYKAYVCVWAGKDGGGDTRYFWTSAKQAT